MKPFNIIKLPKYSVGIYGPGEARGDGMSFGNANRYGYSYGDGCGYGSGNANRYGNMYGSGYVNDYHNGYPEYPKALNGAGFGGEGCGFGAYPKALL